MRLTRRLLVVLALLIPVVPAAAQLLEPDQPEKPVRGAYDRNEIPGHYTLGFYGNEQGKPGTLKIPRDAQEFEVWLGATGDSTRTFSGLALSLDLPNGVTMASPVVWVPRSGLKESGDLLGEGSTVNFSRDCAQQKGLAPLILGRVRLRIQLGVNEVELVPQPHLRYGLSLELCDDTRSWPKPYAEPVTLKVQRSLTLWDRITGWFK